MSTETNSGLVSLDEIIRSYILESDSYTMHDYAKVLIHAKNGVYELFQDVYAAPIAYEIPVNQDTNIAIIPKGLRKITFVGIVSNDGNIRPLVESKTLALNLEDMERPDRSENSAENIAASWPSFSYGAWITNRNFDYTNGSFLGRQYGVPGGMSPFGNYAIHSDLGQIWLNEGFRYSKIYVEGLGRPESADGTTMVPSSCVEALKCFIDWAKIKRKSRSSLNEIKMRRSEFYNQKRLALARIKSFGYFKAINNARRSSSPTKF